MDRRPRRTPDRRRGRPWPPGTGPIGDVLVGMLRQWRRVSTPWRFTAAAGVLVLLSTAGYLVLNSGGPPPRARRYLAFTACLLTDSDGIARKPASSVWAGMDRASRSTRARIQYLPVFGPPTVANARPYLASLIERHCDVIVAAGGVPAATVSDAAGQYPKIRFIAVGASGAARNLTSLAANDAQAPATVQRLIIDAVSAAT